jgi:hypothetical protein
MMKDGKILFETFNVAAFVNEDYMPPHEELMYRVDFVYYDRDNEESDPEKFWTKFARRRAVRVQYFLDESKAMAQAISRLVSPSDNDENKLRKIYAHVQSLRNLSYERARTEQELKRDKIKERADVADVEKYGYGDATELTYLFVALARAAGFKSYFVLASTRNHLLFNPGAMNVHQLNSNVASVKVGEKELFFEPGVPFMPFGMLPWYESRVMGLRIDKQPDWVTTTLAPANQSKTLRVAALKLVDGSLQGKVTVTYTGLDALEYRLDERNEDDFARKENMQNELKRSLPTGSEVVMTGSPEWNGADTPLVIEYNVTIPGWVAITGRRQLLSVGLFGAEDRHTFEYEQRIHPIYFHYPNTVEDTITIEVPANFQLTSVPHAHDENINVLSFSSAVESTSNALRIKRVLITNDVLLPKKYYLALRDFFKSVRTYDNEQIVLTAPDGTSTSDNAKRN